MTALVHNRDELDKARAELSGTVGLVPTMGALHRGHLALIAAARQHCDSVVVSIFVNPMQFNQAADLERYPRPIESDLALAGTHGVDVIFNPEVDTVYPGGPAQVWVTAGDLANQLEGPNRPGHFDGVLTVVTKLFALVRPDRAFFGEKDYQQLTLVRRMVSDLGQPVGIVAVPTVRDEDRLALSSRNVFLTAEQRAEAVALPDALLAAREAAGTAEQALAAARAVLDRAPGVAVEYLELRSEALGTAPDRGPARLLVAARVGSVRLIDNIALELTR